MPAQVDVRRFRVAGGERLERLARSSRVARRHHVARAAGHQHHLPPIRRQLDRQHRHAQGRDAHHLDHPRVVVAFGRELAERFQRLLVLLDARHEHRRVITRRAAELGDVADAEKRDRSRCCSRQS